MILPILTEYNYYNGYELDSICSYELTKKQKEILDNAIFFVDYKLSLRKLSKEVNLGRSQLSEDFKTLKSISYDLWLVVKRQLESNKKKYFK